MKKIIRLTESDLTRIVRRVIMEQDFNPLTDLNHLAAGDSLVTFKDDRGTITVEVVDYDTDGYQAIITERFNDFGGNSGQMKMSNIAIGNEVQFKVVGDNVSIKIPDTFKKPIIIPKKNVTVKSINFK